jgi:hypothetical protein
VAAVESFSICTSALSISIFLIFGTVNN